MLLELGEQRQLSWKKVWGTSPEPENGMSLTGSLSIGPAPIKSL